MAVCGLLPKTLTLPVYDLTKNWITYGASEGRILAGYCYFVPVSSNQNLLACLTNLRFELFCTFFGDFGDKYPQGLLKLMEIVGLLK